MNKYFSIFFIVFVIFVFNVLCFSEPPVTGIKSREEVNKIFKYLSQNVRPTEVWDYFKCPNCHNDTLNEMRYRVQGYNEYRFYTYFIKICFNCDYVEFGYDNYCLYRGTK